MAWCPNFSDHKVQCIRLRWDGLPHAWLGALYSNEVAR